MRLWMALLVVAASLAGCTDGGPDGSSGVEGSAWQGPVCPVERDPPDPQCADRPYNGTLVVRDGSADGPIVKRFTPAASGAFYESLGPGSYVIVSPSDQMFPRCDSGPFTVAVDTYTHVVVDCDTGIR